MPNKIKFIAPKEFIEVCPKDLLPIPAKLNMPQWYKDLTHSVEEQTIKGCIPFMDTLTTGYILKIPQDIHLKHKFKTETSDDDCKAEFSTNDPRAREFILKNRINLMIEPQFHPVTQLGKDCPFHEINNAIAYHKILNPWIIKTPPGYSCLFIDLLNNRNKDFEIISGIVDTDTFEFEVNFPIIVKSYGKEKTFILKKGTPYVQIIPFKRDAWRMSIEPVEKKETVPKSYMTYYFDILYKYKKLYWSKKDFK